MLERPNDNADKIDLPFKYPVHNTFNVCDLSLFPTLDNNVASNLRINSFQEGDDAIWITSRPLTQSQA